ncbi:MAG: hypothetical protein ABFS45_27405 [Pseudomonadota bacterium]
MNIVTSIAIWVVIAVAVVALYWFGFRFYDPFEIGLRDAKKSFPGVAKELGLEFVAPTSGEYVGEIKGKINSNNVRIAPDDLALIEIELHDRIKVHLSNSESFRSHSNEGMEAFDFKNKAANDLFKTRFASSDLLDKLSSSRRLFEFVEKFKRHWGKEVEDLIYSNGFVRVTFRYGFRRYIPAKDIQPMLEDLVVLADILQSL